MYENILFPLLFLDPPKEKIFLGKQGPTEQEQIQIGPAGRGGAGPEVLLGNILERIPGQIPFTPDLPTPPASHHLPAMQRMLLRTKSGGGQVQGQQAYTLFSLALLLCRAVILLPYNTAPGTHSIQNL